MVGMEENFSFGYWLRRQRLARDLRQDDLATQLGIATVSLRKLEADERRPSLQLITRVAEVFALSDAERETLQRVARADLSPAALPLPERAPDTDPQEATGNTPKLPTGTITFLFTDIEASTQRWEQHPTLMRTNLSQHDVLLRQVIAQHGGALVKGTGDGLLAAFAQAADGLAAALAGQRALLAADWGAAGPLRVRMALHSGEAQLVEGDYFGPTLNRTARLLAVGHGGQVLLSLAAAELLRDRLPPEVELRDLGMYQFKDLARPEHVFQAVAPDLPTAFPPLRSRVSRLRLLPTPPNPLIGRETELTELAALLEDPGLRLLTLLGPGGTGKTKLAIAVAADLENRFADGVCFVDLTPVRDPALVLPAIGRTLGLQESQGEPIGEVVATFLREKALLLVLDNCEQVIDAAPAIAALLVEAPRLQVIATSREALRIAAEQIYAVPPLAVPTVADASLSAPAAQLFLARARTGRGDFVLTGESGAAVAAICRRLDGLPLALELAAARLRHLTPQALLSRLERPLNLLTSGARDLPTRQQTLRAAIAWSYNLLSVPEQALFRRLGVFVGGWDLAAAETVGGLGMMTLDLLSSLIDKSLVSQQLGVGGEPRYTMLETIREYALEQLEHQGEAKVLHDAHYRYFVMLAEQGRRGVRSAEELLWLSRLSVEHDNLRMALGWCIENEEYEALARLIWSLASFWDLCGHWREGQGYAEQGMRYLQDQHPRLQAGVLYTAGMLNSSLSNFAHASQFLERSLTLFALHEDQELYADALSELGWIAFAQGDYSLAAERYRLALDYMEALEDVYRQVEVGDQLACIMHITGNSSAAEALLDQTLRIAQTLGQVSPRAHLLTTAGHIRFSQRQYAQVIAYTEESLAIFEALHDRYGASSALIWLSQAAMEMGESERAIEWSTQSLALRRELGERRGCAVVLVVRANACARFGNLRQARSDALESLFHARDLNDRQVLLWGLESLANTVLPLQPEFATQVLGLDERLREEAGLPIWPEDQAFLEHMWLTAHTALGEDAFRVAWASGRSLHLDEVLALVTNE